MPKRSDIKSILIIGAGPIVIGQACEFDYSGAQACKALRAEGYRVILVNSNPATIMTDPGMADAIYVGPDRHRPGLRIRLLGSTGVQGAARRGLSRDPGELEPGDDHDGPGHGRRDLRRARSSSARPANSITREHRRARRCAPRAIA